VIYLSASRTEFSNLVFYALVHTSDLSDFWAMGQALTAFALHCMLHVAYFSLLRWDGKGVESHIEV
jgi:hypothetical protein